MIVIPPIAFNSNHLVSSTIPEPDTGEPSLWNAATAYSIGNLVRRFETKKIYESLSPTATVDATVPEISVYATAPKWREVEFINRYKLLDYTRNNSSVATNTLNVQVSLPQRIDSVALVGMSNVNTILVDLVHGGGTYVIYNGSNSYVEDSVTKYYETRTFFDIPPYLNGTLRVTLTAPGGVGTVSIRYLVAGLKEDIGKIQNGLTVDATNYSKVDRDIYGNSTLIRRRNIPKINGTLAIDAPHVDRVSVLRNSLNATPALWIGLDDTTSDYYNSLVIMGIYKVFSFNIDNPIQVIADIEIEEI